MTPIPKLDGTPSSIFREKLTKRVEITHPAPSKEAFFTLVRSGSWEEIDRAMTGVSVTLRKTEIALLYRVRDASDGEAGCMDTKTITLNKLSADMRQLVHLGLIEWCAHPTLVDERRKQPMEAVRITPAGRAKMAQIIEHARIAKQREAATANALRELLGDWP